MTTTFQISSVEEPIRSLLAASLRRAMLHAPGHLVPDAPPKMRPTPQWGPPQWQLFFTAAGWPACDATAWSKGAVPEPEPQGNPHMGILEAVRSLFFHGFSGSTRDVNDRLPQWSAAQIQGAVSRISGNGLIRRTKTGWEPAAVVLPERCHSGTGGERRRSCDRLAPARCQQWSCSSPLSQTPERK